MVASLFVIEAPGKIRALEHILKTLGHDAAVQATSGHLYEMPEDLGDLGIDKTFRDHKRTARNDKAIWYLRKAAREAETIYVATDADAEGDVIAWDVHELVKDINPEIYRMKLKGMDTASIEASLADVYPVRKSDAVPGRTRAIIDRMIGHSFSRDGIGVGRVSTGLLGMLSKHGDKLGTVKVRLVAPAKDGDAPWATEFDTNKTITPEIADKLTALSFPAIDMRARKPAPGDAMHMGEIMVRAGDELGMTPKESAKSLQSMYETGQMSYPRSNSKGVSKGAQRRLERMIRKSGFRGKADRISAKGDEDVHDAPYPIGDVDVSKDPRKLGDDHGVRTMVARNMVRSSLSRERQAAHSAEIEDFLKTQGFDDKVSKFVASRNWTREIGPRFPGEKTFQESSTTQRMPETVLLEKAVALGLGRPSTWANHIDSFMSRGLCDDNLQLTDKGQAWAAASPDELLNPQLSNLIEKACDRILPEMMDDPDREPWSILAEKIAGSLPDNLSNQMLGDLEPDAPRTENAYEMDIQRIDGGSDVQADQTREAELKH
ncbi:DNA topoisomerase [Salipiger mucosus]|uniref:DNA topoisomerase I n=1 Tax=Salipiger mucosus DSM 16094 TaxID=1123237 RepID=S9QWP8_9RHOB|nr:DNA topoisomerase [Salipiger mucosus]EPX84007.1 DNA topoisomerase I [Salipiger mucosus DSM 16094]